jgi:hypothetical protein
MESQRFYPLYRAVQVVLFVVFGAQNLVRIHIDTENCVIQAVPDHENEFGYPEPGGGYFEEFYED